jgi:hypothetical protein
MFKFQFKPNALTSWLLIGAMSGVLPAMAAEPSQPGTLATSSAPIELSLPLHDLSRLSPLPRAFQEASTQGSSGASTAHSTHHISKWVWVAIAAGAGVAIGTGVILGNKQSGKTAATTPTATVGTGSGGVTAGAP